MSNKQGFQEVASMRIATWNVERLSHQNRLPGILEELRRVDADVLVLTETDRRIQPDVP